MKKKILFVLFFAVVFCTNCSNNLSNKKQRQNNVICEYRVYGISLSLLGVIPIGWLSIINGKEDEVLNTQVATITNRSDIDTITRLMNQLEGRAWDNVGDFRVVLLREYCDGRVDTFGITNTSYICGLGKYYRIKDSKLLEKILIPISEDYYQSYLNPHRRAQLLE